MSYGEELLRAWKNISCRKTKDLPYEDMIKETAREMKALKEAGGSLYFIGNGGSAAIAVHMTGDYLRNGKIRTHGMYDPATVTCLANDFGYEFVFSKQLEILTSPGDILVAISSSGKSQNILNAVNTAKEKNCKTLTLSGFAENNPLRGSGDWSFYVPSSDYGKVETLHNMILQEIVDEIIKMENKS